MEDCREEVIMGYCMEENKWYVLGWSEEESLWNDEYYSSTEYDDCSIYCYEHDLKIVH